MAKTNLDIQKTITKLQNFKRKIASFLHAFLEKFKNVKFLIPFILVVFLLNSFFVFRLNYSEDFGLVYRYERPTIILGDKNYLEMYRFHDYLQNIDKSVDTVLSANYETKFNENKNIILDINSSVEESALGDKADIKTNLNRIDANNFEIQRETVIKNSNVIFQADTIYMELILGGPSISFSNNTVTYGKCNLKLDYPADILAKYNNQDKVITFSTKVNNNNDIKFNIKLNINCD